MPINVPQSVFDKYYDVIDSTFTIFGVTCKLVYIETVEEISTSYDNFPTHNSISAHRRGPGVPAFVRETTVLREVEKTEEIKLKVYWDSRAWVKVGSNIVIPDNSIQTISYMTDLPKILRAKELIVHKDIESYGDIRFKKTGEHYPMGLKQTRYVACFWERT
jgi:hypothetical protein|tara:strand:- start:787 stop:1272 length:486 start_codon:yes stop_codon:yes gene_type:complete